MFTSMIAILSSAQATALVPDIRATGYFANLGGGGEGWDWYPLAEQSRVWTPNYPTSVFQERPDPENAMPLARDMTVGDLYELQEFCMEELNFRRTTNPPDEQGNPSWAPAQEPLIYNWASAPCFQDHALSLPFWLFSKTPSLKKDGTQAPCWPPLNYTGLEVAKENGNAILTGEDCLNGAQIAHLFSSECVGGVAEPYPAVPEGGWQWLAENGCTGPELQVFDLEGAKERVMTCINAYWNEIKHGPDAPWYNTAHYTSIMSPGPTHAICSFAWDSNGGMYSYVNFARAVPAQIEEGGVYHDVHLCDCSVLDETSDIPRAKHCGVPCVDPSITNTPVTTVSPDEVTMTDEDGNTMTDEDGNVVTTSPDGAMHSVGSSLLSLLVVLLLA